MRVAKIKKKLMILAESYSFVCSLPDSLSQVAAWVSCNPSTPWAKNTQIILTWNYR
jgi:hypothetical protein